MDRLISMVAFVNKYTYTDGFPEIILNYANFLSEKLELWMFVPCKFVYGVLVVLEEPFNDGENDQYYLSALQEYQEAKERILFEGYKYDLNKEWFSNGNHVLDEEFINGKTIERLVCYTIILTKTAQKQIGL